MRRTASCESCGQQPNQKDAVRELVWTGFVSVDGVADSPGGAAEGHPAGGWVARAEFLPEVFALKDEELEETTALLLGRRSYETFAPYWQSFSAVGDDPPLAGRHD